ncbi:hypothetical protein [Erwinia phage vB_Ea277G]|nr:hypothetical protein [Erwinia phage vB_Ea277G]
MTSLFAINKDVQEIYLTFVDDRCEWRREISEKGYHSLDQLQKITVDTISLDWKVNESIDCPLSDEDMAKADLNKDFTLYLELDGGYGTLQLINKDGVLTLGGDSDINYTVSHMSVKVEANYYLGDHGVEGIPERPLLIEILALRSFLADLELPVFASSEPGKTNGHSPWLGLFNEAVHKVKDLRKSLAVDHIQYSGDAPELVVSFFEHAQTETPDWFWTEQEKVGHVAMALKYDDARRFCLTAIGHGDLTPWRDVHVALYQLFACSLKETLDGVRDAFFQHVRGVYRKHKAIQEKSPSVTILLEAYYDFDYVNIYQGVRKGTLQYLNHLEIKAHQELWEKIHP